MADRKYYMVQVRRPDLGFPFLTVNEVAFYSGVHPELVERFLELGLIEFTERDWGNEPLFTVDVVPLIRKILRLRNELGVNYAGIGVILELMAHIESLEARIRELEERILGGE
ncbi:MAG: hypothetical protein KBH99_04900 [Syntrophobacteraceae bacterium]|nr:hypothetical protein [Syntrophobacteraceae bacterium]